MEVKGNPGKDEGFEILSATDSFADKSENIEIIPLENSSHEAINMISSSLAQSITEESFPKTFDFSDDFTDLGFNTNMNDNSDEDFIKIDSLTLNGNSFQADDEVQMRNSCYNFEGDDGNPLKGISRNSEPDIKSRKPNDAYDSLYESLRNMSYESIRPEVKNELENDKIFKKEMYDVNVLPTMKKHLTDKKRFKTNGREDISSFVLNFRDNLNSYFQMTYNSENEKRFKALQRASKHASSEKIYSFDSLEIVRVTSQNGKDSNADSVHVFFDNTKNFLPPEEHENFNEERFAVNTVLNGLGKDFRKCKPVEAHHGREVKTTSSTIAFRKKSSRGICEAMFNSLAFCKWIKKSNIMKRVIDTAKVSIEFFLNTFETEINSIVGTPRKLTVVEYLEGGGASLSEAVAQGLRKDLGQFRFETVYYGSEGMLFHPFLGDEAAEEEARRRIQTVRSSGAVASDGIVVAPVMVLSEDDEGGWQIATLLYLQDPEMPKLSVHTMTPSEPVERVLEGKGAASWYMVHDCRRLKAITAAAELLGTMYYRINACVV